MLQKTSAYVKGYDGEIKIYEFLVRKSATVLKKNLTENLSTIKKFLNTNKILR